MKEHLAAAVRSFVCALVSAALGALLVALMLALYDIERTVMLDIRTWVLALALQAIVNELLPLPAGSYRIRSLSPAAQVSRSFCRSSFIQAALPVPPPRRKIPDQMSLSAAQTCSSSLQQPISAPPLPLVMR